jgi:E3 ubiquitin-protein ligase UBR4
MQGISYLQQQTSSMSTQVATALFENNIMDHCLAILNRLMEHWQAREKTGESEDTMGTLLKPQPGHSPPDMSPFFLKQYVKVFSLYHHYHFYYTLLNLIRSD